MIVRHRAAVLGLMLGLGAHLAAAAAAETSRLPNENDRPAPVDRGYGPGVDIPAPPAPPARGASPAAAGQAAVSAAAAITAERAFAAAAAPKVGFVPAGRPDAGRAGFFGHAVPTPIMPIHVVLLPDGRVLSFGTNEAGAQGAKLVYDIWDPALGTGLGAHWVLPNTTLTDIFCAGQATIPGYNRVLIVGGDRTVNGVRNHSIATAALFDPAAETIRPTDAMAYPRWYPTLVAMPDGRMVVLGGRKARPAVPATTPEVFDPETRTWRSLTDAAGKLGEAAYGGVEDAWFYPRAFLNPKGRIFVLSPEGRMFDLDPARKGSIREFDKDATGSAYTLPSVMYAPGRILSIRNSERVALINLNGPEPVVTRGAPISQRRAWGNATVLADGKVLVDGGSAVANKLKDVAYHTEIWDPATDTWTRGASAKKPRLYHSSSLLLADGSVLTTGGGAPGPVKNLNKEIYYPPYLYANDRSGRPAHRPKLVAAPDRIQPGRVFAATVAKGDAVGRVTMVRAGSASHSINVDQRFLDLPFTADGTNVRVTVPTDPNTILPGDYLLFVFNKAGTPSVAKIVQVRM